MKSITLEIRDRWTMIPVVAVWLKPSCEAEHRLLRRAGYTHDGIGPHGGYVLLAKIQGGLNSGDAQDDPFSWPRSPRTMLEAHRYICANIASLESGDVVDVEFILGESTTKKAPEGGDYVPLQDTAIVPALATDRTPAGVIVEAANAAIDVGPQS